jgi:hypothetical protein
MMSKNRQEIANKYAAENNFDSAEIIATRGDDAYYRLDFKNRPRYTGYPDVIKISSSGKVSIVLDKNEIYWAIRQSK